jgi:hypothetical protein
LVRQLRFSRFVGAAAAKSWLWLVLHTQLGGAPVGYSPVYHFADLCCDCVGWHPSAHEARRRIALADKVAEAIKGLPPEQQEVVAKRIVDEALK